MANLKLLKLGIVYLLSSPASLNVTSVAFETATRIGGKFSEDDHFELLFERNFDLPCVCVFFAGKTERTECTSCWIPFIDARVRMTHQPQVHGWYT